MKYLCTTLVGILLAGSILNAQKTDTTQVSIKVITHQKNSVSVKEHSTTVSATHYKKPTTATRWFETFDLGFNNFIDKSDYASSNAAGFTDNFNENSLDLKQGKSIHVGVWIFEQLVPLVKHNINLNYGLVLDLNNYRFKNDIRFNKNNPSSLPTIYEDKDATNIYKKTKLAADYITVPVMLNFNFSSKPPKKYNSVYKNNGQKKSVVLNFGTYKGYGFSIGGSAGYLYTARNKFVNNLDGKKKIKDDFGLRPWKISYDGEVNLGFISFFGSYSPKSIFKNHLEITPYTFGIRL